MAIHTCPNCGATSWDVEILVRRRIYTRHIGTVVSPDTTWGNETDDISSDQYNKQRDQHLMSKPPEVLARTLVIRVGEAFEENEISTTTEHLAALVCEECGYELFNEDGENPQSEEVLKQIKIQYE